MTEKRKPIIKRVEIKQFRALRDICFDLAPSITALAGKNGTLKTTLLGLISQPFSLETIENSLRGRRGIDGYDFKSQLREKIKLSEYDIPGEHTWKLHINEDIYPLNGGILEVTSIKRDGKSNDIRFWSAKNKSKGSGYAQCPVIYLSLKRVYPIAEIYTLQSTSPLEDEEKKLFLKWYKDILTDLSIDDSHTAVMIDSPHKKTLSISSLANSPLTISAGQDNLGKILLAILTFKRLSEKCQEDYKGGVLFVDEIESTLHPSAIKKLIKILAHASSRYNIQIVITTHSNIVLCELQSKERIHECKTLFLSKKEGQIRIDENPSIEEMECGLSITQPKEKVSKKYDVYSEDEVGCEFVKILKQTKGCPFNFQPLDLGAEQIETLISRRIKGFTNSILVIDGDKRNSEKIKKHRNVVFLPGDTFPEKFFYNYLFSLSENDSFWGEKDWEYTQEHCFADYMEPVNDKQYKDWYHEQKINWGKNGLSKLKRKFMTDSSNEVVIKKFCDDFEKAFKHVKNK